MDESEWEPIAVEGEIHCVKEFPYLGSVIADSGRMDADVECKVAKASKAFGALRKAVFLDTSGQSVKCIRLVFFLFYCMGLSAGFL